MFASVYSMCVSQFVDVVASPVKLVVSVTVCGVAARAPIAHDHRQGLMIHGCIVRVTTAVIMQVAARFLESTARSARHCELKYESHSPPVCYAGNVVRALARCLNTVKRLSRTSNLRLCRSGQVLDMVTGIGVWAMESHARHAKLGICYWLGERGWSGGGGRSGAWYAGA